ncbi:GTPase activating protein [Salix suchowensis]|nr:GTPase activating protein [Salix suchowensis]
MASTFSSASGMFALTLLCGTEAKLTFRWVLISFKREFSFDDVLKLWEVLWTDYYSIDFVLFIALAILESHRDMILRYLVEFDEILKYCNELSMTIELDSTIAQAEVLFLSFSQLVADMDRRRAEALDVPSNQLRQRHNIGSSGPSGNNNVLRVESRPFDAASNGPFQPRRPSSRRVRRVSKGIFHFLLLPRVQEPFSAADLSNLRSLLKCDRNSVKATLEQWKEDAKVVVKDIEDEMVSRYGFKWDIWMAKLDKHKYEALLKEDLACWRCGSFQKNIPALKAHLQTEFEDLSKKEKAKQARKRKFEEKQSASNDTEEEVSKKPKTTTGSDHEAEE